MEERIEEIMGQMSLEEKVSLLAGVDFWHTKSIDRLGIPSIKMTDGPHGTRTGSSSGISHMLPGNCYPTGSALAATWNTDLINQVGAAIGEETKAKGCTILLGPTVNIQRSPLAGRNFESYSEDPYLSSRLAVAIINGIQSRQVSACVKHFAMNNSEYQRLTISSEVQERAMHEIYLPAFEAAIKEAGSWSIMSAYNKLNGTWCSENSYLLNDVLKNEWGFDGVVISDWGAVHSTIPSANTGLDIEMPGPPRFFGDSLLAAINNGEVLEETINDKVRRFLRLMIKTGVLEKARVPIEASIDKPGYRQLAYEAAAESIVLLKNRDGMLPLDKDCIRSIAVIGPNAAQARISGGGTAEVKPYYAVTPLEGIKKHCGDSLQIAHEPGCYINRNTPSFDSELFSPDKDENGKGLTGEFFSSFDLSGASFRTQTDEILSHMWMSPKDPFSCRWTGHFRGTVSGIYTFGVLTDGFARVYIGDRLIIDKDTAELLSIEGGRNRETVGEFRVSVGQIYPIKVEYRASPSRRGLMRRFRLGCQVPVPPDLMERAIQAAKNTDVVIIFVGNSQEWESEGFDRNSMELPGEQVKLIEQVAETNPNTVVVLNNGAPVSMHSWLNKVAAVVEALFPGQECGNAIADVLFGVVNPSGKLPVTFPVKLEDNPAYTNYPGESGKVCYNEGIYVGYRYYDKKHLEPLFPFGYGLSYTTFEYSNLKVTPNQFRKGEPLQLTISIKNTGNRPGKETVQLYVSDVVASVSRPPKELKGFQKVSLQPGEEKTASFYLDERSFAFYDPEQRKWSAESGEYEILMGSSSRDIRSSATVNLM